MVGVEKKKNQPDVVVPEREMAVGGVGGGGVCAMGTGLYRDMEVP